MNKKIDFQRTLFILFISLLIPTQMVQAKTAYSVSVDNGDVMLSIDNEKAKLYKNGAKFSINSKSIVCYESGDGVVNIKGGHYKKRLSEKGICKQEPKETPKKTKTIIIGKLFAKGELQASGTGGRGSGTDEKGSEKIPSRVRETIQAKLNMKNGVKYFYFENEIWQANRHTLPMQLDVIIDKKTGKTTGKKYYSRTFGKTIFEIPWLDIQDKNKKEQSYYLRISNKFNNILMKPSRFTLIP